MGLAYSIPVGTPTVASQGAISCDCLEHAADAQGRQSKPKRPERIAHLIQVLFIRRKFDDCREAVIDLRIDRERHAGKTLEYIFQQTGFGATRT